MQDAVKKYEVLYKKELKKVEKTFSNIYSKKKPHSLYEPINYILRGGGKRIRPFLVAGAAKSAGSYPKNVYNASLAVEILHNFTLVHDDIMDNADKRRGRDTLHIRNNMDTAILAGDIMTALAYESLLRDCGNNAHKVVSIFTNGIIEVCEGQALDKEFETRNNVSLKEYKVMIYKKTAALMEMCCLIGANLGKARPAQVKALGSYGKNLGMAFQIQDDLLDLIAEEKELGKPVGGDLVEGKKTYLFIKALEKARGNEKKMLLDVMKNKGIKKSEIEKYKSLYLKLGVIEDAKKEIKYYTDKSVSSLKILGNKEGAELLKWLAFTLLQRNK